MNYRLIKSGKFLPVLSIVAFVLFTFSLQHLVYGLTDGDGDGYASSATGGLDCQDSKQSVYKDNTSCDDSATHTLLTSYDDPDGADDIFDHTWIQDDDGLWHIFYQWNLDGSNNNDIGHFTSTDFTSLTKVGDGHALLSDDTTYYDSIWAPHVIKRNNLYYMYFTGVERRGGTKDRQRIGLATSTDLTNWTLHPTVGKCAGVAGEGCIYECDNSWTTWGDGGAFDEQCRDPMVIRDEANNRWLMLNTVKYQDDSGATIDVATSTNLVDWTGLGYVKAARKLTTGQGGVGQQTDGGQAENPFITEHDGKYYLVFSDWNDDEGVWNLAHSQYAVSDTLEFDASGSLNWEYKGPIPIMGVNANEIIKPFDDTWIISGSISNPNAGYPSNIRSLILRRMEFNDKNDGWSESSLIDLDCRVDSVDINPGATEICNDGIDNNCSGTIDEDSVCNPTTPVEEDDSVVVDDDPIATPTNVKLEGVRTKENGMIKKITTTTQYPKFSGLAEPKSTVKITIYSDPINYSTTTDINGVWSIKPTRALPKGIHTAYAIVTKGSESSSIEKIATFSIESTSYIPTPTVESPRPNQYVGSTTPTISGLASSGNTINVYIDNVLNGSTETTVHGSGTGRFSYTPSEKLSIGQHTLKIEAIYGKAFSTRSKAFNFWAEPPTIGPTLFALTSIGSQAIVNGVAWGDTNVRVYANGTEIDLFYVGNSGVQSFSRTLPSLGSGSYIITMRAYDPDGKASKPSNALSFTATGSSIVAVQPTITTQQTTESNTLTHIVQSGDTMWSIAQSIYGNGRLYTNIVQANAEQFPELLTNPSVIRTGWQLIIP